MLLILADLEAFKGGAHLNCSEFGTNHPLQPHSVLPFLPFAEASAEMSSEQSPASARQQSPQWRFTPGNMQTGGLHGLKST